MRQTFLARLRRTASGDGGVVLVAVLLTAFVLSLLGAALLAYTTQQMPQTKEHQDRQAALAAAEAGIEDFLWRINGDPEYFSVHTDENGFDDPANPSWQSWVPVPGAQDDTAQYRIDSVTDAVLDRGVITLQATGRVGSSERTVRVELSRRMFTDYAYLSDLEVNDPRNVAKYPKTYVSGGETLADVEARCGVYAWKGRSNGAPSTKDDPCATIAWTAGDITEGKVHSNDLLEIQKTPIFNDHVESGCSPPGCGTVSGGLFMNYKQKSTGATFKYPDDGNGFGVIAAGVVAFPKSNRALRRQAESPNEGCLFTGPTRIVLKGTYAQVWSRNSRETNGPSCGGDYTTKTDHYFEVPMTEKGLVIYVQDVPSDPTDPNYTDSVDLYSVAPFIPGAKPARSPATYRPSPSSTTTKEVPDGFPLPEDKNYTGLAVPVYGPGQGDVLVEGTLDGRLTVGAEDDIIITDHILRKDAEGDLVGLVANNFLWNYHPVNATSGSGSGGEKYEMCGGDCMEDVRIEASIMSVNHAYGTMFPGVGNSQGTISTYGSLVQKWRNNVGGGTFGQDSHTGYAKKYAYDPQLRYTQPPHFLQPESLVWGVSRWAEP